MRSLEGQSGRVGYYTQMVGLGRVQVAFLNDGNSELAQGNHPLKGEQKSMTGRISRLFGHFVVTEVYPTAGKG